MENKICLYNKSIDFFLNLKDNFIFDIYIDTISNMNFRVSQKSYIFPAFDLNDYLGMNTIIVKLSNNLDEVDIKKLSNSINNYIDNESHLKFNSNDSFLKNIKLDFNIDDNDFASIPKNNIGIEHIGLYKDSKDNLYLGITSKLDLIKKINEKFDKGIALKDTIQNLDIRRRMLEKRNQINLQPEQTLMIQKEFECFMEPNLNHISYTHRHKYLSKIKQTQQISMFSNMVFLDRICKENNFILANEAPLKLDHTWYDGKSDCIYYFSTPLYNQSLVFYNIFEGFGILNNIDDQGYIIPSIMFNTMNNKNKIKYNISSQDFYESDIYIDEISRFSRILYNKTNFFSKDETINKIYNYIDTVRKSTNTPCNIIINETEHLKPLYICLF